MKAFKGFNKDLQCTPSGKVFQYELGKSYEEPRADLCSEGFHACENPFDTMGYYNPADGSRYCEVDLDGVSEERDNKDTKRVGSKITIGAELHLKGLLEAGVNFVFEKTTASPDTVSTTGYGANAATTGYRANAATTGYGANAATTGDGANAATTGYGANAATTGYRANAATTGDGANAATTGDGANAATTGYGANAATTGERSISAAIGIEGTARGAIDNWLVLAEWKRDKDRNYYPADVKTVRVDGEVIKANTNYKLVDGQFVEAEDE